MIVAINWSSVASLKELGPWEGRIVVDANNAIEVPSFRAVDLQGRASSDVLAEYVAGASVVKAFNHLGAALLAQDPREGGGRRVLFYSGHDAAAKDKVAGLVASLGFAGIDLGTSSDGGRLAQFPGGVLPNLMLASALKISGEVSNFLLRLLFFAREEYMPVLQPPVIEDVAVRLQSYLHKRGGYSTPNYLASGGSAAIFRADGPAGPRAFKVFDPKFFEGESGMAERRRLEVQRRLIGHTCGSLVQTYEVEEAEATAFMEMELVSWPNLTSVLSVVPDAAVGILLTQLVQAARFLEDRGIVHRDIKPENIHVSADFRNLKLLDLGVARDIEAPDGSDAAITDQGNQRLFLATAQYSSPEYLFRLDEPSSRLWRGLNFYQIGAVLHDLIMKACLFNQEISAGNRWLVAKAVLTKTPSFSDGDATRLSELKALAARCLVKDLDTRLQIIGWDDFSLEGAVDPINALRGRLAKGALNVGPQTRAAAEARLEFDRAAFVKRFIERVRTELISICGNELPLTMIAPSGGEPPIYTFLFAPPDPIIISCQVAMNWLSELHSRDAQVSLAAVVCNEVDRTKMPNPTAVCVASIDGIEDCAVTNLATAIAAAVGKGLDFLQTIEDPKVVQPKDLRTS